MLWAIIPGVAGAQWVITPQIGRLIRPDRMPKETPELQVQYARSLMQSGDYARALYETTKFDDFYADSDFADDNQFIRGEIRMAQGKYRDAATEFQQVIVNYPDSDLFVDVIAKQYEIGDTFYAKGRARLGKGWWRRFKKRPFKRAIEIYTMVIDNQPFTDAAAEAQYKVGLCYYTREDYVEAAFEYQRVIEDYGKSAWVDEASYGLAMCYYQAARPPEYDQAPSLLCISAVDDFKEQLPSDPRLGELEKVRAEMRERVAQQRLMAAQFYEKRRRFTAAAVYYEVVAQDFSDTSAAKEATIWLKQYGAGIRRASL
jgi:outer membrane assembly lipoprotein YfiO